MPRFCRENRRLQGARTLAFLQILQVEEGCRRRAPAERSVSVNAVRLIGFTLAALVLWAAAPQAAPSSDTNMPASPEVRSKPAAKPEHKSEKPAHKGEKTAKPDSLTIGIDCENAFRPATVVGQARPALQVSVQLFAAVAVSTLWTASGDGAKLRYSPPAHASSAGCVLT